MVLIAQPDDDDAQIGIPLAGSIVGLLLGAALTEGDSSEEDPSEDAQAAGFPAPRRVAELVSWRVVPLGAATVAGVGVRREVKRAG